MAANTFTFRLVTPQRLLLESPASLLEAPGSEGYLGILANHAPIITALSPGKLEVRDDSGKSFVFAVSGGFLEVSGNRATVLADSAEPASEIDRERAEAALKRAESRLRGETGRPSGAAEAVDRERARRAFERAKNRLAVAYLK